MMNISYSFFNILVEMPEHIQVAELLYIISTTNNGIMPDMSTQEEYNTMVTQGEYIHPLVVLSNGTPLKSIDDIVDLEDGDYIIHLYQGFPIYRSVILQVSSSNPIIREQLELRRLVYEAERDRRITAEQDEDAAFDEEVRRIRADAAQNILSGSSETGDDLRLRRTQGEMPMRRRLADSPELRGDMVRPRVLFAEGDDDSVGGETDITEVVGVVEDEPGRPVSLFPTGVMRDDSATSRKPRINKRKKNKRKTKKSKKNKSSSKKTRKARKTRKMRK
jgi:hypothetical protein